METDIELMFQHGVSGLWRKIIPNEGGGICNITGGHWERGPCRCQEHMGKALGLECARLEEQRMRRPMVKWNEQSGREQRPGSPQ